MTATEIRLAARPNGVPTLDAFACARVTLPQLGDGQVLVRNLFMSVDPSMRGRMNDVPSYVPPFALGMPLEGRAIGQVLESRTTDLNPGDIVQSARGWRDYFVAPATEVRTVDASVRPLSAHLGVLGMPGLTAWIGLKPTFVGEVSPLIATGTLKAPETVVTGLENAPQALLDLLTGGNVGKMIVKIS